MGNHGGGVGLGLGMHLFSEFLKTSHKSRWRIVNNIQKCKLCGKCETICHVNALTVNPHKKTWMLNNRRCTQCLSCVLKCPARCLDQVRLV